jgi:hypothetical protein
MHMRKTIALLLALSLAAASLANQAVGVRAVGNNSTDIGGARLSAIKAGDDVRGEFEAVVMIDGNRVHVRGIVVAMRFGPTEGVGAEFSARAMANGRPVMVHGRVEDNGAPENDKFSFRIVTPQGPVFGGTTERQSVHIRRLER